MSGIIHNEAELEACVGKTPAAVNLKVIDHLDVTALRWLETATLCALGLGMRGQAPQITLAGGSAGFLRGNSPSLLSLPLHSLDHPHYAQVGMNFGSLFFSPGLGETLRINGCVVSMADDILQLAVEECYLHCAKALIRSAFWQGTATTPQPESALVACPFMLLATMHRDGAMDLSPKGDPAGTLFREIESNICFADRPGNRRMDSLRNMLSQPQVAVLGMFPGCTEAVAFSGAALVSTDEALREKFNVEGRQPKLLVCVATQSTKVFPSRAIAQASLWPVAEPAEDIDPATIFASHVRLNKTKGVGASIIRATASKGLMKQGLKYDYKNNLY